MPVRTKEIPFLTSLHGEIPLRITDETLKVIRAFVAKMTRKMTNEELTEPLFQQHGKNALSVFEAYQKAPPQGKDAATTTVNSYLYYIVALGTTRPRHEIPRLAWYFMFAPSVSGACPVTGGAWLAEALKITVADRAIFDRGREIRINADSGLVELEFDGELDKDGDPGPPVISVFQATGKFMPETRAIKLWSSIAIRKLKPLFALLNAED